MSCKIALKTMTALACLAPVSLFAFDTGYCTYGVDLIKGGVPWTGDAQYWYKNAQNVLGTASVGNTPIVGAIIVYKGGTYGHVGVVSQVDADGKVSKVIDMNGGGAFCGTLDSKSRCMPDPARSGTGTFGKFAETAKPVALAVEGYIYYKMGKFCPPIGSSDANEITSCRFRIACTEALIEGASGSCQAYFKGKPVTTGSWSSSNKNILAISAKGGLTAPAVTANANATITASYSENKQIWTATTEVSVRNLFNPGDSAAGAGCKNDLAATSATLKDSKGKTVGSATLWWGGNCSNGVWPSPSSGSKGNWGAAKATDSKASVKVNIWYKADTTKKDKLILTGSGTGSALTGILDGSQVVCISASVGTGPESAAVCR
ncbi:CHAP domain-containing protein [uncultured Thiodictyon sp.]|uniref:CHAP domain-containing protein n=1 Tax=uncultured Thiodictyon sp. TaxID=1846217 RepID=UPI0025EB57D5|nr:CHAP domain-containing protein [uncultured Thiodictyon sp.]